MLTYMIGNSTKAEKAAEIEFYMEAPLNLQAIIIPNLRVCACLHHMAVPD